LSKYLKTKNVITEIKMNPPIATIFGVNSNKYKTLINKTKIKKTKNILAIILLAIFINSPPELKISA
jgi:hypothetical protein